MNLLPQIKWTLEGALAGLTVATIIVVVVWVIVNLIMWIYRR